MIEIKKNSHIWILLLIVVVAIFLRTYKFSDWILFRADQARDADISKQALDKGLGYLPVLGPEGGDSVYIEGDTEATGDDNVYLGPIYYYFQYFSALIFQSVSPAVFVLPDLLFSIFSIPLFYYLLRHFFPSRTSLLATALFAFSFFLVQHARFSWNPNPLVFWQLLQMLCLYKVYSEKDRIKAGRWLVALFGSLGVITQLHFLTLFGAPAVVALFWIFYHPKSIRLKYWLVAFGLLLLLYAPMIAFELKNNGENLRRLVISVQKEDSGDVFFKTTKETIEQHGSFYAFALTSFNKHVFAKIELVGTLAVFFSIGFLSYVLFFDTILGRKIHLKKNQKAAIVLFLIYFFVFFVLYSKISHVLGKQRYWLATGALPFILYAIWIKVISGLKYQKINTFLPCILTILLIFFNLTGIAFLFLSLEKGHKITFPLRDRPTMRPYNDLVTLEQIVWSVNYMNDIAKSSKAIPCYSVQNYQVKNSFKYVFKLIYPESDVVHGIQLDGDLSSCKLFFIADTDKAGSFFNEKYANEFILSNSIIYKAITIWEMEPKIKQKGKSFSRQESTGREEPFEHTWKKVFAR